MSITLSLPDRPIFGLSDAELLTHLDEITAAERALAAARLETVAELSARGIPAAHGYAHPTAFLREHLKLHPAAAWQMHRLATAMPAMPDLADALAKSAISESQAAVIATAVTAIAAEATTHQQTQAAQLLVSQAAVLAPKELALCGTRILHHVAPETAEQRDRQHVEAAERSAWQARAFTITPDGHGRYRLRGSTTAEGAALLHTILDPLTHPRRHGRDIHGSDTDGPETQGQSVDGLDTCGPDIHDPDSYGPNIHGPDIHGQPVDGLDTCGPDIHDPDSYGPDIHGPDIHGLDSYGSDIHGQVADGRVAGSQPTARQFGPPEQPGAFRDPRSAPQRRHDALLDGLRLLLNTDTLPDHGGSRPQLAVTVGFDLVRQQLEGGWLDIGAPVSAAEARRLACDAGILPAILDSHGVPLDLGRERRLINGALRKALILRDRGCAWPGCDRPPRWCQAHHAKPWNAGGRTCLTNSVLVCGFHHRLLHHDEGWTVHIGADGHPWFTPPAHLDPQQTPRRNLYHHRD